MSSAMGWWIEMSDLEDIWNGGDWPKVYQHWMQFQPSLDNKALLRS